MDNPITATIVGSQDRGRPNRTVITSHGLTWDEDRKQLTFLDKTRDKETTWDLSNYYFYLDEFTPP